jgi:hypothetical protein
VYFFRRVVFVVVYGFSCGTRSVYFFPRVVFVVVLAVRVVNMKEYLFLLVVSRRYLTVRVKYLFCLVAEQVENIHLLYDRTVHVGENKHLCCPPEMDLVTKFLTYRAWFSSPLGGLYGYIFVSASVDDVI